MVWQRDEYGADYLVGEEAKYDNEDERLAYWQREEQAFEREKEEIFDVASDMTRQYKGMQEELLSRINLLENQINELKDQLEGSRLQLEETRREKAQVPRARHASAPASVTEAHEKPAP